LKHVRKAGVGQQAGFHADGEVGGNPGGGFVHTTFELVEERQGARERIVKGFLLLVGRVAGLHPFLLETRGLAGETAEGVLQGTVAVFGLARLGHRFVAGIPACGLAPLQGLQLFGAQGLERGEVATHVVQLARIILRQGRNRQGDQKREDGAGTPEEEAARGWTGARRTGGHMRDRGRDREHQRPPCGAATARGPRAVSAMAGLIMRPVSGTFRVASCGVSRPALTAMARFTAVRSARFRSSRHVQASPSGPVARSSMPNFFPSSSTYTMTWLPIFSACALITSP